MSAFSKLAKTGNTLLLPANTGDVGSMVAQAMSVYNTVQASTAASSSRGREHSAGHADATGASAMEDADLGSGIGLESDFEHSGDGHEVAEKPPKAAAIGGAAFVPKAF
jgi:hypothetical protein